MEYDAIVIGAGLSGLSAASLLAKRGLHVAVVDRNYMPGGSCGIFKRRDAIFDQGSAMLFGFGESGFNSHRFLMNCLEEPMEVIQHPSMYRLTYKDKPIEFYADIDRFVEELSDLFPAERDNLRRFYKDLSQMYQHVMVEVPVFSTADETKPEQMLPQIKKHPMSYIRFLTYLMRNAHSLLRKYFTDPDLFKFFDKLTSTYCYTPARETPAVLAAVMFVDNHVGGSFYPAGSTLFLPGKLEKVIEEHGGDMVLQAQVDRILFEEGKAVGVHLMDGRELRAPAIVYGGTVWNLYQGLLEEGGITEKERAWARGLVPTAPSAVLHAVVDRSAIPEGTLSVEMLSGDPDRLDEDEITVYLMSLEDRTLCGEDEHVLMAIGPSFGDWQGLSKEAYQQRKEAKKQQMLSVLERKFPGISGAVRHAYLATPRTIERYTMKNGGAAAGPKQMMGQHMFKRLHTRTRWPGLYACGESTVMGTGTPTVTVSGISAANAILEAAGLETFQYRPDMPNYVTLRKPPYHGPQSTGEETGGAEGALQQAASRCQYCERPACTGGQDAPDIRGLMRRLSVGNLRGAGKVVAAMAPEQVTPQALQEMQARCIRKTWAEPVAIETIVQTMRAIPTGVEA